MNFEDATKTQLLQICLWEECPIEYKYESARELQLRQWRDEYLTDLVRLWGKGYTLFSIAIELGLDEWMIQNKLTEYGLWKRRVMA